MTRASIWQHIKRQPANLTKRLQHTGVRIGERRLVYTSAGDRHRIHRTVRDGAGFDLAISFYGDDERVRLNLARRGGILVSRKGGKFPNLYDLHRTHPTLIAQYDAVFVVDNDLSLSARQINQLFDLRQEHDLWIIQPSFDLGGRIAHSVTRRRQSTALRWVNFIELCAPLFRGDKLEKFLLDYDGSLVGWGIDYWYMNLFGLGDGRRYAISDEVSCVNPRRAVREIQQLSPDPERRAAWYALRDARGFAEWQPSVFAEVSRSRVALSREMVRSLGVYARAYGLALARRLHKGH